MFYKLYNVIRIALKFTIKHVKKRFKEFGEKIRIIRLTETFLLRADGTKVRNLIGYFRRPDPTQTSHLFVFSLLTKIDILVN
jgi:hypothetical protein